MRLSSTGSRMLLCLALLGALATVVLAGCGSGSSGSSDSDSTGGEEIPAMALTPGLQDWPYFGRVPQRTHYMPDDRVDRVYLAPPLKQAWSINTHALIEFPPAIHQGVAYVINKYGNGKAVRLSDRKILWEMNTRPSDKG